MTRRQAVRYRLSGAFAVLQVAAGLGLIIWTGVDPHRVDDGKHLTAGAIVACGICGTLMILCGIALMFGGPDARDTAP